MAETMRGLWPLLLISAVCVGAFLAVCKYDAPPPPPGIDD